MHRYNNKVFAPFQFKDGKPQELLTKTPADPPDAPTMGRKKWPLVVLLLLVLTVAVCTLPWPTNFEYTFFGARVDADGKVTDEGTITVTGTRYTYLFKEAQIRLTGITLPGSNVAAPDARSPIFTLATPGYERIPADVYVTESARIEILNCYLSADQQTCVLTIGKRTFAGSTDPDFDPQALIEYCVN